MKGKHAALSANRRYTAAMEHIDRLTSEMADLKIRAKKAEADANAAAGLRREVALLRNDPAVNELIDKINAAFKHRERDLAAWKKAEPDLKKLFADTARQFLVNAECDVEEFLRRRYPNLIAFLSGRDADIIKQERYRRRDPAAYKLGVDASRRLERAIGLREIPEWAEDRDMADVAVDLADVVRMKLSTDEIREILDLPRKDEAVA